MGLNSTENRRILVVEDDESFRSELALSLQNQGFDVTETDNGNHAKKILEEEPIQMVISDIKIPGMDGIDLVTWAKKNLSIPVVIISGFPENLDRNTDPGIELDGLLTKPFKNRDLIEVVEHCLGSQVSPSTTPQVHSKSQENPQETEQKKIEMTQMSSLSFLDTDLNPSGLLQNKSAPTTPILSEEDKKKRLDFLENDLFQKQKSFLISGVKSDDLNHAWKYTQQTITQLTTELEESAPFFDWLEKLKNTHPLLLTHSFAVSLYSVSFGERMGFDDPSSKLKLSIAGLFHDLGKTELSLSMIQTPLEKLSIQDQDIFQSHALRGKNLFSKGLSQASHLKPEEVQETAQIISEHHLKPLLDQEIHPLSEVVFLANEFCRIALPCPENDSSLDGKRALLLLIKRVEAISKAFPNRLKNRNFIYCFEFSF